MTFAHLIRFDDWTLDLRAGELEHAGRRVRLQDQPLQVLQALLERPGDVVTREELVERLWPKGVVDFETGLNTAIRRLRAVLGDDADAPRYIETLPRRGYRFIGRLGAGSPAKLVGGDPNLTLRIGATESVSAADDCLVIVHAPQLAEVGRRCVLRQGVTRIGREGDSDVVLSSPGVSRRHARVELRGDSFYIVDEGSTNGVIVNDHDDPTHEARLHPGDELLLGDVLLRYLGGDDADAQYREVLQRVATIDGLTGLCTRRQFDAVLGAELLRARRHERPLSVLLIEIEDPAALYERYGRLAVEAVLRGLGAVLRKRLRPEDVAGRYSDETLCAMLPETALDGARHIADALASLAAARTFTAGRRRLRANIKVGAASRSEDPSPTPPSDPSPDSSLQNLYAAAVASLQDLRRGSSGYVDIG